MGRCCWLGMLFSMLILSGCLVGPNFEVPPGPAFKKYTNTPLSVKTASVPSLGNTGKAQYFANGKDIPGEWWRLFHSTPLNNLIELGLANSPTLVAAKATLLEAQESLRAQTGALLFPNIGLNIQAERETFSAATFGIGSRSDTFNLYTPTATLSYTLDIFGGSRRQLESLLAEVNYQHFELEGAYLTLTSNIVASAINIAALEGQITATEKLVTSQQQQLSVVEKQLSLGGASTADVLTQQSQLAQTTATLPPLRQKLAEARHALAVLVGIPPSETLIPSFNLDKLTLPNHLPVSLPSSLLRQRPDIRAAEALLHQASAQVGVATANLFPQITLTGNYGWTADHLNQLFQPNANIWYITGQLLQPVFNGGSLRAQRRATVAAYEASLATYRQAVLQGLKEVADVLRALENDAKTLKAQRSGEIAAYQSLGLTQRQFRLGGVSYLSLLVAQRQYQQAKIARIQAQATRFADTTALFQALGGGWWNRQDVPSPKELAEGFKPKEANS